MINSEMTDPNDKANCAEYMPGKYGDCMNCYAPKKDHPSEVHPVPEPPPEGTRMPYAEE